MGARIKDTGGHAPLTITGSRLKGRDHLLSIASAQVKSALLLAGLYSDGSTVVHQPGPARDHTERMLAAMGADLDIDEDGLTVAIHPGNPLSPLSLAVPADLSSAAFVLVAALLVPDSQITLEQVGVNTTRTGLLDVLKEMEANIQLQNHHEEDGESIADVNAETSSLKGVEVRGSTVVRMIDEFPILAVAATQAHGATIVSDATELRVKETDRIAAVVAELAKLGANIDAKPDGFVVRGPTPLHGAKVDSHGDHRLAMALTVAGLIASGTTIVHNTDCIADSFPGFDQVLEHLQNRNANSQDSGQESRTNSRSNHRKVG
jgi:3-phosphoshikimate 1-carboxyvinyltransferase